MKNKAAKIIYIIGIFIIVIGAIGSLFLADWIIIGIISSILVGVLFLGFAELIELSQKKLDQSIKIENLTIRMIEEIEKNNAALDDELPEL